LLLKITIVSENGHIIKTVIYHPCLQFYFADILLWIKILNITNFHWQDQVFWVVTPCSAVVGYQCFGGPGYLHLQGEDEGILPQSYTASQSRRTRLETSPPWKPQNSFHWQNFTSFSYMYNSSNIFRLCVKAIQQMLNSVGELWKVILRIFMRHMPSLISM